MTHLHHPIEKNPHPIDANVDIGHVHMRCSDLQKPYKFYVEILGFEVMARLPGALFLSAGGYHHHLAFNTWESAGGRQPPPGTTGLYHIAIRYPTRCALAEAIRHLINTGYPLDGSSDHGTHEALYLHDLEGNGIELYWDRPTSEWPRDKQGHIEFVSQALDIQQLLTTHIES